MKYLRNEAAIQNFGQRLKEIRLSKKMSQEQVAYAAEIEYSQYSRIERGIINTSLSHIASIATALGVSPADFFKNS